MAETHIDQTTEVQNDCAWAQAVEESSGQSYYYNTVTGVTQWEVPEEYTLWKEQQQNKVYEAASEVPSEASKEPTWSKYWNEDTQAYYYCNNKTGDTQWDVPPDYKDTEVLTETASEVTLETNEKIQIIQSQDNDNTASSLPQNITTELEDTKSSDVPPPNDTTHPTPATIATTEFHWDEEEEEEDKTNEALDWCSMEDKEDGLCKLNLFFESRSYVRGYTPTQSDMKVFSALGAVPSAEAYAHLSRWYSHISQFDETDGKTWPV